MFNDITPEMVDKMNNEEIKEIFDRPEFKVKKGIGVKNKFSYSVVIADQEIAGQGIIPIPFEEVKKKGVKFNKYLIYNPKEPYPFEEVADFYDKTIKYENFEASMGIDIATGEQLIVSLIEQIHTGIVGATGSGKSVFILNALYQMMMNPYTEFYVVDKNDFGFLENSDKTAFRKTYTQMTNKDLISFFNYFILEYARRQKMFDKLGVANWLSYEKKRKEDPSLEKLNFYFVIIDEYQSIRKQFGESGDVKVFDNLIKKILDTVRSTGMIFYFGTQDFKVQELGSMHSSIVTTYSGKVGYHSAMSPDDLKIVSKSLVKTNLFYEHNKKKILKVPFSPNIQQIILERSNKPEKLHAPIQKYTSISKLLNDSISRVDSDIFNNIELFMKEMNIKTEYIEKVKESSEYIPFSVLFYSIYRLFRTKSIVGKNTDIFAKIDNFSKDVDKTLFDQNIGFYVDNKKFVKSIEEILDLGQDAEKFKEAFGEVMNTYFSTILGETNFKPLIKEEEPNIQEEPIKDLILATSYAGDIKPVSFNGMYYPDKNGKFNKTSVASEYENTIKQRIVNKMVANKITQVSYPVILDIEFTLSLNTKKDGELSKVGRNDLDNLLKATIDGISKTIIKDDTQVYLIRTKMNYVEKQSLIRKNNGVEIKVLKLTKDTYGEYLSKFDTYTALTPSVNIPFSKQLNIVIPSVNNSYFVDATGKTKLSADTIKYKRYLGEYVKQDLGDTIKMTTGDCALYLDFSVNNSENRDLDNMLKATIDAFTDILYKDDTLVKEIICIKRKLTDVDNYNGKIKMQLYEYDLYNDIINENNLSENKEEFLPLDDTSDKNDIDNIPTTVVNMFTNKKQEEDIKPEIKVNSFMGNEGNLIKPLVTNVALGEIIEENNNIINQEMTIETDNIEEESIESDFMDNNIIEDEIEEITEDNTKDIDFNDNNDFKEENNTNNVEEANVMRNPFEDEDFEDNYFKEDSYDFEEDLTNDDLFSFEEETEINGENEKNNKEDKDDEENYISISDIYKK